TPFTGSKLTLNFGKNQKRHQTIQNIPSAPKQLHITSASLCWAPFRESSSEAIAHPQTP
ncbi:hypothetical protein X975_24934, partial [Stegodyphus mimosarum]